MYAPFWRILQTCYQVRMFHVNEKYITINTLLNVYT